MNVQLDDSSVNRGEIRRDPTTAIQAASFAPGPRESLESLVNTLLKLYGIVRFRPADAPVRG